MRCIGWNMTLSPSQLIQTYRISEEDTYRALLCSQFNSSQMNFSDGERDSEGTILRVYISVWSDECHVWSLILALRNTKLWVELNGPNLPSARVFFCVFQLVRINLTSGIHFYQLCQRADTAGTGKESKGIKSPMKSLSKSSYMASFLV